MKNIAVNLFLIVFVFLGVTFFSACDDGYTINTKEMIKEEEDLIDDYLALFEDSLGSQVDTINKMEEDGFLFFEMKKGTGDTVRVGKKVAFRYNYYQIVRDSVGDPFLYGYASNYESPNPVKYMVGSVNSHPEVYRGIDLGIRYMKYGTRARILISSSLWNNDYKPRVAEIEVTYVEK